MVVHSLHGPGFMAVTFLVFAMLRLYQRGKRNYGYAAAIAFGIAIFGEAAQIPGPRNAEVIDIVVDVIGIIGALGIIALLDRDMRRHLNLAPRLAIVAATLTAVTYSVGPTAWWSYSLIAQQRAVPALLTFEKRWEWWTVGKRFVGTIDRISAPEGWPLDGTAVRVTSSRRGSVFEWKAYRDWRDFDTFTFLAATDDGSERDMIIVIADKRGPGSDEPGRYRTQVRISPTPTRLRISIDEMRRNPDNPLDIAHINYVFMRLSDRVADVPVIIDDFRFES